MTQSTASNAGREPSPWDALITARTADAFCRAWLGIVCQQIPTARVAAVLVEDNDNHQFVPIAVWPKVMPDLGRLSGVVELALQKRKPVIQPAPGAQTIELAYPVMRGEQIGGLVVLEVQASADATAIMRQLHWSSAWLVNLFSSRELELATQGAARSASVLNVLAVALRHDTLKQALFEITNAVGQQFGGARVAIGLVRESHVRLAALSETAHFDKNTPLAKAYTAAMEETLDLGRMTRLVNPPAAASAQEAPSGDALPLHARLLSQSGSASVISCPLLRNARVIGVMTVERKDAEPFSEVEILWLDAFTVMAAPIIGQREEAEQSSWRRLLGEGRRLLDRLFGPGHLIWKTAAVLLTLAALVLSLVQINYRVTTKTVIEGEVQRVIAAPFSGFIHSASVRAGDRVRPGQPLARLDDRELRIEQARWISERDQYAGKLREALATHNLTDVQVIGAQLQQAEAQLALVSDKLERSLLKAPYEGIVVSGDLSQQIGAPVEPGKELFTIAPLQSYRVILQVDEREIRHIRPGQAGQLVIIGIAGEPVGLTVSKVTPVASSQDGQNFFRVEATLAQSSLRLRPGMEGVGKIETGRRQLWWILTHPLTDWLSLMAWKWLP